jgi:hypothetical protein
MHNIHNVFHIRLSLFLKQLDMNEEDILRITDDFPMRHIKKKVKQTKPRQDFNELDR